MEKKNPYVTNAAHVHVTNAGKSEVGSTKTVGSDLRVKGGK